MDRVADKRGSAQSRIVCFEVEYGRNDLHLHVDFFSACLRQRFLVRDDSGTETTSQISRRAALHGNLLQSIDKVPVSAQQFADYGNNEPVFPESSECVHVVEHSIMALSASDWRNLGSSFSQRRATYRES